MPSTSWRLILSTRDPDASEAWDRLVARYWKPVYKHIRLSWRKPREEAEDLTQAYLTSFFEKRLPSQFDPQRGRFRTFLRVSLENFLRSAERHERAIKRGGGAQPLSLDFDTADAEPGRSFDDQWLTTLLENALQRLRAAYAREEREIYFAAFRKYYLDPEDRRYRQLARELGIRDTDLVNFLHHARTRFRKYVREEIRDTVDSDGDFEAEYHELLRGLS